LSGGVRKDLSRKEKKTMMYTVWTTDYAVCDEVQVFEGTLEACLSYIDGDDDEFYIVEPDGFTVWG
jgi:hypothetical protein